MRFEPQIKLTLHKEYLQFLKDEISISLINVEISPTGLCNASCPWCFYKDMNMKGVLDRVVLLNLLYDLKKLGVKAISWTGGGEPTLHPNFNEVILLAQSLGFEQGMFTNCLAEPTYDSSVFDWIRVSLTNLPFNKKNISKLKSKVVGLCINYIGNKKDIVKALKIADELNLNYVQVRPALNGGGELTNIPIPLNKHPKLRITKYKFEEARKQREYTKCYGYNFIPFIWQDGIVSTCAYHKGNKDYELGNLYDESIIDIISKMPRFVKTCENCQICCRLHETNKIINTALEIEDVNFV